jgi:hypothetical protein
MSVEEDKQAILAAFRRNNAEAFAAALEEFLSRVAASLAERQAAAENVAARARLEVGAASRSLAEVCRTERETVQKACVTFLATAEKIQADALREHARGNAEHVEAAREAVAKMVATSGPWLTEQLTKAGAALTDEIRALARSTVGDAQRAAAARAAADKASQLAARSSRRAWWAAAAAGLLLLVAAAVARASFHADASPAAEASQR